MKRRIGFVSNSSSSSFVCLTTTENFKRAVSESHPYVKAVIMEMVKTPKTVFGIDCLEFTTFDSQSYSYPWDDFELDYDGEIPSGDFTDEICPQEAFEIFVKELKKYPCEYYECEQITG